MCIYAYRFSEKTINRTDSRIENGNRGNRGREVENGMFIRKIKEVIGRLDVEAQLPAGILPLKDYTVSA